MSQLVWDEKWEKHYRIMEAFINEHGRLPKQKEIYEGDNIGTWYAEQKRNCKKASYPKKRKQLLEELTAGVKKQYDITIDEQWKKHYQILEAFINEHGRLPKQKEIYEGDNIGAWYASQKHKCKKTTYPENRRQLLDELTVGVKTIYDTRVEAYRRHDETWEAHYQILELFVKEHGRLPKHKEIYEGDNIGTWYANQKHKCKKATYPEKRKQLLREISLI